MCVEIETESVKLRQVTEGRPTWPVYANVFEHPPPWLASQHPVQLAMTPVNVTAQWRYDCSSASVVIHIIVTDPTIRQSGFNLSRYTWSLLNHFQTG